jgi:predicted transposase YbfD/YdcC
MSGESRHLGLLPSLPENVQHCLITHSPGTNQAFLDRRMEMVRGHWSIENRLHWPKDVLLKEDNT